MGNSSSYSLLATAQWYSLGSSSYTRQAFQSASARFSAADSNPDLSGTHIIVTGANRGLGLSTALALASRRAHVHLLCRDASRGNAALEAVSAVGSGSLHVVDLASVAAVKDFARSWEESARPLHGLVLNAGFIAPSHALTADGLEPSWATAMLQSFLLTALLAPALKRGAACAPPGRSPGARVIHVSSGGGLTVRLDVDDPQALKRARASSFDGTLQYAFSKRAQMMLAARWSELFRAANIGVYSSHPGWCDTPGVREALPSFRASRVDSLRTEAQGADTPVWLASANVIPSSFGGELIFDRAVTPQHFPMAGTQSTKAEAARLWAICEAATGYSWSQSMEEAAIKNAASS